MAVFNYTARDAAGAVTEGTIEAPLRRDALRKLQARGLKPVKVEESDDNSSYSNVTALVGGGTGGFAIPAIAASATGSASILKLDVDTKAKKRYLKVSYTPGASATVSIVARLGRGEVSPETAAQAGVIGQVRG
jgi:hypothetical protein